jgi:hypothetical protein
LLIAFGSPYHSLPNGSASEIRFVHRRLAAKAVERSPQSFVGCHIAERGQANLLF